MSSELRTFHDDLLAVLNNHRHDPQIDDGALERMLTSDDPYVLVTAYHLGKNVAGFDAKVFDRFKYTHMYPVDIIALWVMSPQNSELRNRLLEKLVHSDEASFDQYRFGFLVSVGPFNSEFRTMFWRRMFNLASSWDMQEVCYWLAKKGSEERQRVKRAMSLHADTFDRVLWLHTHCRPDDPLKARMRQRIKELA